MTKKHYSIYNITWFNVEAQNINVGTKKEGAVMLFNHNERVNNIGQKLDQIKQMQTPRCV